MENTPSPAESSDADEQPPQIDESETAKANSGSRKKAPPKLNPVRVMRAMGNPIRWGIMQALSEGQPIAGIHLAKRLKAEQDNVTKHLRVLELAGLVSARPGQDARYRLYTIRPPFQEGEQDGIRLLDLGFCVLRFPVQAGK